MNEKPGRERVLKIIIVDVLVGTYLKVELEHLV